MKSLFVLLVVVLLSATAFAGPVTVAASTDAMAMATALVGDPNIVINSATYTGAANASGFFAGGAGVLPYADGILLTSGTVQNALGPNTSEGITGDNGLAGDADLNSLVPGYTTHDASILTIVFTPTKGTISFQYVFGSDEYTEWVGSAYNDVFGFFLNGVNLAVLPGTSIPVSINSVNGGANSDYYTNNEPGSGVVDLEYDGLVGLKKVLYAQGTVNPGVENTIKIAIADSGDWVLDSGVFLKGGSFINEPAVPEPGSMLALTLGLLGVGYAIRRRRAV